MAVELTHLQAMALFAAVVSLAFAFLNKGNPRDRMRYAVWSFLAFLLTGIAAGWLMYYFSK